MGLRAGPGKSLPSPPGGAGLEAQARASLVVRGQGIGTGMLWWGAVSQSPVVTTSEVMGD